MSEVEWTIERDMDENIIIHLTCEPTLDWLITEKDGSCIAAFDDEDDDKGKCYHCGARIPESYMFALSLVREEITYHAGKTYKL